MQRCGVEHTNDGDIVLGSLELPQSNVDSDTTLTLGLKLVQNPGVLEGTLAKLSGYTVELSASFSQYFFSSRIGPRRSVIDRCDCFSGGREWVTQQGFGCV